ncbi:hypothetical protein E4U56_000519 [Claviceps arundinis]|uniref:Phospho-2-dehydro-3-deoxyheptonate aldolase n=1 Tax=Claviceps arundinis TaxID=1623583 RepID=A0A9P7SQZ2_9HYPO|nr:hypothetical protein E4U56_000519 [Claviceps arundinis]
MKANDQIRAGCKTPLLEPATVKVALAADQATQQHILRSRDDIRSILSCNGSDTRLMVIVGPCSIHDVDEAIEYASLLSKAAELHRHELFIVMRVYVEKPRSTVGWKGLVHEPDYAAPTRSISKTLKPFVSSSNRSSQPELNKGVLLSRKVMLDVAQRGLPVATELLNPLLAQYFDDITSLGVIGARTTESQTHRELASSMPMPVGFKNGTDGSLKVATDAMTSASHSHTLSDTFVILRGGSDGPNFDAEHVASAHAELRRAGRTPAVVVDCSHGNSMKDYRNQAVVAACLADQIASGVPIKGVMIESNIHQGRQDVIEDAATGQRRAKYGVSITDGCIGWQETLTILGELAAAVKIRQQKLGMAVVNTTLQVDCEKSRMTQQVTEVAV